MVFNKYLFLWSFSNIDRTHGYLNLAVLQPTVLSVDKYEVNLIENLDWHEKRRQIRC